MNWTVNHYDTCVMDCSLGNVTIRVSYGKAPIDIERPGPWAISARGFVRWPSGESFPIFSAERFPTATAARPRFLAIKRAWPRWLEDHPDVEGWVMARLL